MKKICFLLLFTICISAYGQIEYYKPTGSGAYVYAPGISDDWYRNLEKYWMYRYRLINDFTCIGPNSGESLIAYRRIKGDTHPHLDYNPNYLDFADDQTIDLGSYMGVLATEYEALRQNGFRKDSTLREIQYAVNAFDRLRCHSHAYYEMHTTPNIYPATYIPEITPFSSSTDVCTEGFFLRDDVPYFTFIHKPGAPHFTDQLNDYHWQHFNRPYLLSSFPGAAGSDELKSVQKCLGALSKGFWGTDPSTGAPIPGPHGYPEAESQDQLNQIFLGQELIMKYLDDPSNPMEVAQRNRSQNGIYHALDYLNVFACTATLNKKMFAIPDPEDRDNYCMYHSVDPFAQIFYPSAVPSMYGLHGFSTSAMEPPTHTLQNVAHNMHAYATYSAFMAGALPSSTPNCCSYASLNTLFEDTYSCFGPEYAGYIPTSIWNPLLLPVAFTLWNSTSTITKRNRTWNRLAYHYLMADAFEPHIPLVYQLNWGDRNFTSDKIVVESLLNSAPSCGTWCYENSNSAWLATGGEDWNNAHHSYENTDWSGNNRLTDAVHRQGWNCYGTFGAECHRSGNDMGFNCDFNGLDYMLLFNLYALERGSSYMKGMISTLYMNDFNVDYPNAPTGIGSSGLRLKLNWLQYISVVNKVHASSPYGPGWLDFRGARKIDLKPGFHAEKGSFFLAHIKDYNCSGGDYGDGPYHFAELNPDSAHLRPIPGSEGMSDTGWRTIEYYQPGFNARPLPVVESADDNDSGIISLDYIKQFYKDSIIKYYYEMKQDSDLIKEYGNPDSLLNILYPGEYFPIPQLIDLEILPNPTSANCYMSFNLSKSSVIDITLLNTIGESMKGLVEYYDHDATAGQHKVLLHTDNLVPGLYYAVLKVDGRLFTKKISLIR